MSTTERKHTLTSTQVETLTWIEQGAAHPIGFGRTNALRSRGLVIDYGAYWRERGRSRRFAITDKGREALAENRA